jgi:two-component system phosphate regulon sensor histidine kinase PhoR
MAAETNRRRRAMVAIAAAVVVSVVVLASYLLRTLAQADRLREQSLLAATYELAQDKTTRVDRLLFEQDDAAFAMAEGAPDQGLAERWLPTAARATPTIRALLVLDEDGTVVAFASRSAGPIEEDEEFRRLVVTRFRRAFEGDGGSPPLLRHLHRNEGERSFLLSYRRAAKPGDRRTFVAWHDLGRVVKDVFPRAYGDPTQGSHRLDVLDEQGRIIFGPPLRSSRFTVSVRFATTIYGWRLQLAPAVDEELASGFASRRRLDMLLVLGASVMIVAGVISVGVAADRAWRASELKSSFVANVSHELKTPLALVRMFSEMLHDDRVPTPEKRREYLGIIHHEAKRLDGLLDRILDFARLERQGRAFEFRVEDPSDAIASGAEAHRSQAATTGIALRVRVDGPLRPVRHDPDALTLAVSNLVDNAFRYAVGARTIEVTAENEPGAVLVTVRDDGEGIPEAERSRVFEKFVRGTTGTGRGTGLGLAIVSQVVRAHRGTVALDAAAPRGARFRIRLPIAAGNAERA